MRFLIDLHEHVWIMGDIYLFIGSPNRAEKLFCLDTVWAIVLGIDGEHKKFDYILKESE
jgi:hypothetical protein